MTHLPDLDYARSLDGRDPLASFRNRFNIPVRDGSPVVYFMGNSLGLQPKNINDYLDEVNADWANLGVEGHTKAAHPWMSYHRRVSASLASLVGARSFEVVAANSLSVNLHLMLASFWRPAGKRVKLIMEAGAFPSDQYAVEMQARIHGLDPKEAIIEIAPRPGETLLRTEDIEAAIKEAGDTLALALFSGIQYYTGQILPMEQIVKASHAVGAYAGFDLAHAVGNIPLQLHEIGADFAVWCSYKYLNSSPGGIGGLFVHERHAADYSIPRMAGWWGHSEAERFKMEPGFKPMFGAEGWQLSNPPVMLLAAHKASLDLFDEAGVGALHVKAKALQSYLDFILAGIDGVMVITPAQECGCQRSMIIKGGKKVFNYLIDNGIICDWREPEVSRVAPVPLYNSFEDIWRFGEVLKQGIVAAEYETALAEKN
ncbi:MAG: kynureninase [Bacteroidota bacterium]